MASDLDDREYPFSHIPLVFKHILTPHEHNLSYGVITLVESDENIFRSEVLNLRKGREMNLSNKKQSVRKVSPRTLNSIRSTTERSYIIDVPLECFTQNCSVCISLLHQAVRFSCIKTDGDNITCKTSYSAWHNIQDIKLFDLKDVPLFNEQNHHLSEIELLVDWSKKMIIEKIEWPPQVTTLEQLQNISKVTLHYAEH